MCVVSAVDDGKCSPVCCVVWESIWWRGDLWWLSGGRPQTGFVTHILVLGVPNNRLTCMQGQKTLSFSYNMHLFYLIRSTIHFSKPLLCVTLICGDWSDWLISFKAECSAALCLALPGKQLLFMLQKRHLVATSGQQYGNVSWWCHWACLHLVISCVFSDRISIRFVKTFPFTLGHINVSSQNRYKSVLQFPRYMQI